jgi:hypothetical protein
LFLRSWERPLLGMREQPVVPIDSQFIRLQKHQDFNAKKLHV